MNSRATFEYHLKTNFPSLSVQRDGTQYVSVIVNQLYAVWKASRREAFEDLRYCAQVQGRDAQERAEALIAQCCD